MKKLEMKPESLENVGTHNILKNTKGITLIAVVITIIVLLILAGVSISAVMGENGIATKAKEAKEETDDASFLDSYVEDGDFYDKVKEIYNGN